ncbi:MAG: phosphohydrolase [Lachnospiraceae bacterium]|nr:phosphohydrolase [Lachnospiraceae bacterium]
MYEYELKKYANDIFESENFRSTKAYIQHGNMSVQEHSINVAKASLYIRDKFKVRCNTRDLIRGALLHDYFLYDWHKSDEANPHRLHGFFHPSRSLRNAQREYHLTPRQRDIIIKHMWPLTVIPPMCREAWIVTSADKFCSLMETLYIHRGRIHSRRLGRKYAPVGLSGHGMA